MGRTRDVSKILTANTSLLSLASASATYAPVAAGSLIQVIPTSVSAGATITSTGAVNFTAQSSISLNGCFTSTYDNYRVNVQLTAVSAADVDLLLYGRASGVNTTTNMASERIIQYSTTITGSETGTGRFGITSTNYPGWAQYNIEMKTPFLSQRTIWNSTGAYVTNAGVPYQVLIMGYVDLNTSFDGITIYPGSGTITGTVRVYGYRN